MIKQPLYPHLPKPHLTKVELSDTGIHCSVRPTWLQLAEAGYDLRNRVHVGIAAAKMKCTPEEARRRLGSAHRCLGTVNLEPDTKHSWLQLSADRVTPQDAAKIMNTNQGTASRRLAGARHQIDRSEERFAGSRKIACEAVGATLLTIAAPSQGEKKAATEAKVYRAKQRGVGTIARHAKLGPGMEAITEDNRARMAQLTYIETGPRNPLQRHIDEAAAAGIR